MFKYFLTGAFVSSDLISKQAMTLFSMFMVHILSRGFNVCWVDGT